MQQKIKRIADTVHGNIEISDIEKALISQHAFNRLHNVMQNSTAFLTFPANQTKRFSHSVGVMYISGEIFYNSISNAEGTDIEKFMVEVKKRVTALIEDSNIATIFRANLRDEIDNAINGFANAEILDPLYKKKTPAIVPKKYSNYYILMFQAIRCAALLHDIGHPPFSHVTEDALLRVMQYVQETNNHTSRMDYFLSILKDYYNEKTQKLILHEEIGNTITNRLLETVAGEYSANESTIKLFYLYVHQLAIRILKEQAKSDGDPFYKSIHSIISGPIDCDRLDYVTRDLVSCGFKKGQVEYDRLLSSMKLFIEKNEYLFLPSVRVLSTIEDFFEKYVYLYKYAIFHHRVIKTDHLLRDIIYKLSIKYLENPAEENTHSSFALPLDISGLWKPIKDVHSDKKYFNLLTQWDDAWLLTVLRQIFYGEYQESTEIIAKQLEEFLSNKKYFHSLIKRMDDFSIIDEEIIKNLNISDLEIDLPLYTDPIKEQHTLYNEDRKKWRNDIPSHGFFYTALKKLFNALSRSEDFTTTVEQAIIDACKQLPSNTKDLLINFKDLKTGLEKEHPMLYSEKSILTLGDVSRIAHDVSASKDIFPQIFIYILLEKNHNTIPFESHNFLKEIGHSIGSNLSKKISKEML